MIFNVRYYIVTMTAIFLALGIGMFSGIMLDNSKILEKGQIKIIENLEKKFDDLKKEKSQILMELKKANVQQQIYNGILEKVFPDVIKNKLIGYNVLVIQTHQDNLGLNLVEDLKKAGAKIQTVSFNNIDSIIPDMLKYYPAFSDSENNIEYFIYQIAEGLLYQETNTIIETLKNSEVLNVVGDYPGNFDYIIIVDDGKSQKTEQQRVIPAIIQVFKKNQKKIIAVESDQAEDSYISFYKRQKISTIDNINTVLGRMTLIYLMEQGIDGHYGIKKGSEELFPLEVIE